MKPTVYIETSIIGHLTTRPGRNVILAGHQESTRQWWEFSRDRFDLRASQLVIAESQAGDPTAAAERLLLLEQLMIYEILEVDVELAQKLLKVGALPPKAADDALHVAIATTNQVDYLLTWNLKHINNPATKPLIEATIKQAGYWPPVICTPDELLEVES